MAALIPFALFPLHLLILGHVAVRPLAGRVLAALVFLLVLAIPAPFMDTRPVIGPWGSIAAGWYSAASLLLRGFLAVITALALSDLLPLPRLGAGLSGLGLPTALVTQVMLLLRYLALLESEARRMRLAATLRGLHSLPGPRLAAEMLASLFARSVARAERIHAAMISRGYRGELPARSSGRPATIDCMYAASWIAFLLLLVVIDPTRRLAAWLAS